MKNCIHYEVGDYFNEYCWKWRGAPRCKNCILGQPVWVQELVKGIEKNRDAAHTALRTILDNHDKLTAADCADIARGVLGGEK